MKTRSPNRYLLPTAAALLILGAIIIVMNRSREENLPDEEGMTTRVPSAQGSRTEAHTSRSTSRTAADPGTRNRNAKQRTQRGMVQVSTRHVLATVNGRPIQIAHLGPRRSADDGEVAMVGRTFRSRLRRAIEAELVFQAADARGIELTGSQQQRLDEIQPKLDAGVEGLAEQGVSWHSLGDEELSFKRRMTEAMLLRQNLVASTDAVAPSPDSKIQAQYEQALQAMLDSLKAIAVIESP